MIEELDLAVLIPCHNEEMTIEKVISDFKSFIPNALIYVYDNGSTDNTSKVASQLGVLVFHEPKIGKGNVIRRMFADIEADIFVMVDGDATYDASIVSNMIEELISNNLDIVIATRKASTNNAYRSGHILGNKALTRAVSLIFDGGFKDMLSGYRVMSRRFV